MTSYVKSEVMWLPSQEEVKQEKDDCFDTMANTHKLSYGEMNACKTEITYEISIKEEPQEPNEDEDLASLNLEHINHPKLQADDTPETEECEKVNFVDLDENTGLMRMSPTEHDKKPIDEKCFVCDICNKKFNKVYRSVHLRIHTGEKPFSCDMCNKKFRQISGLIVHKKIHTGEKAFSCDVCNRQFTEKSHLNNHRRIHTGEKPFSCDVCEKQFTQKVGLIRHSMLHRGEKPFKCDLCNKQFILKSDLTKHRRIHTGEKPYSCDVCNKQFSDKRSLVKHSNTH